MGPLMLLSLMTRKRLNTTNQYERRMKWEWKMRSIRDRVTMRDLRGTRIRPLQNPTETKIRLISEALQARDTGDLAAAQRALSILAQLLPNDQAVVRLRADTEARALAQQQARQAASL